MDDLMTGEPVHTLFSTLTPTVLSFEPVSTTAHYSPGITCAFCDREGQFNIKYEGQLVNYCPGCELTWVYKREEKNG